MDAPAAELARLRLERDLYRRLLEIGEREDVRPFLDDALGLIVELTGASRGYLELDRGRFWIARGFSGVEIDAVRREISTGIIARSLASRRTLSTACALDDPRFAAQQSVQAGRIQAVLCAPVDAGSPLGVLYLQGRAGAGPFPEEDRALTETFARCLARLADRLLARRELDTRVDHTAELRARLVVDGIAGTSRALEGVFRQLLVAAPVSLPVLITGESGTGKTALARALHASSQRAAGPFLEVNCAALPETLFESELFGAEKGAHSTATRRLEGKVDAAAGGTLLLDEIGEIPLALQGKLLMFLQSRRYYRLGGSVPLEADVRLVAATNRDLTALCAERRFREDLYYRLNVLELRLPPISERPEDVVPIALAIVAAISEREGKPLELARSARAALAEAEWPGNVRQLENALSRGWATALSEGSNEIGLAHLFPRVGAGYGAGRVEAPGSDGAEPPSFQEATHRFQAGLLRDALEACGWNVSQTARRLDLSRSRLNELIRVHGLSRSSPREEP
jgi:Nif-specific regulatory protein